MSVDPPLWEHRKERDRDKQRDENQKVFLAVFTSRLLDRRKEKAEVACVTVLSVEENFTTKPPRNTMRVRAADYPSPTKNSWNSATG